MSITLTLYWVDRTCTVLTSCLCSIPQVTALDALSTNQKAELLLDPDSGALDNETIVKQVFISLTEKEQLDVFFETFVDVTKEVSARYSGQDFLATLAEKVPQLLNFYRAGRVLNPFSRGKLGYQKKKNATRQEIEKRICNRTAF